MIGDGGDSDPLQKIRRLFDLRDGRSVNNHVAVLVLASALTNRSSLRTSVARAHDVAKVRAVEAGDVLVGIAQLKLLNDVVPHALRGARCKSSDRAVGKLLPQAAQLAVFRTKLVAPLRDAVRFVNGEEGDRYPPQPIQRVRARQAFRRKI